MRIESEWIDEIEAWSVEVYQMGIKKISSTVIRVGVYDVRTQGVAGSNATYNAWHSNCKLIEVGK